ncbi:MAG: alpha/beta fold hydrolase [Corallococcus sp.]|nr:alpha/beta fold hydrolase [Corallococcus sp.]
MSKAVMTIHGFLTDVADFGNLYDYLGFYDEVLKCEVPGHNGDVDFKKFLKQETLDKVLYDYDKLRSSHDSVDVVGFSMGGALTSYLCCHRDVHRAVMVAPSNKYLNFKSLANMIKFYYSTYSNVVRESTGDIQERFRLAEEAVKPYKQNSVLSIRIAMKRILPNINFHTYGVFRDLMNECNSAVDKQGKCSVPSLIMWGELDELVPRASVEYVHSHFTDSKLNIYRDVGHAMLMTNKANVLINDIIKFLGVQ